MHKAIPRPLLALLLLLGLGGSTTAQAGVPEDLTAYKAAGAEVKAAMVAITDEATAKVNEVRLETAVVKFNTTGAALDASLAALDRSVQANGTLYADTLTQMQALSQELSPQQVRLMSNAAISAVVTLSIGKLTR